MNPSIIVSPPAVPLPPAAPPSPTEVADLLRQLLDVQREQLAVSKAQAAAQDPGARWRAFLARWQDDFPEIGAACQRALPAVERAYLGLVRELTDRLTADGPDDLDNEFVLAEFLDRFGPRLGQLGTVLSQLSPLADAAGSPAASDKPG